MKKFYLIKKSAEIIDHVCDDSGINLVNTEEEADVIYISSKNRTNDIYMNYDGNYLHKFYPLIIVKYPQ